MKPKKIWRAHKIPETPRLNFRVLSIIRKIEKSRGFQTEERFVRAIENGNGDNPAWYKGMSWATKKEDQRGIDFIIHTIFGDIFVQIKSSEAGAIKFYRKRRNFRIIVLIIKSDYKEENIRNIFFSAIQAEIDSFKKPPL